MSTAKQFRDFIKKEFKQDVDAKDGDSGEFVVAFDNKSKSTIGVVWAKDNKETLNHELLHATMWVLDNRGIRLSKDSEEIFCYYQGFLLKCITEK